MKKLKLEYGGIVKVFNSNDSLIVLNVADEKERSLSIYIGAEQTAAINDALENKTFETPFVHELIKKIVEGLQFTLKEVVLIDFSLEKSQFQVNLVMTDLRNEKEVVIKARIGDALAIAFCFKCPIYANESVFDNLILYFEREKTKKQLKETGKDDKTIKRIVPYEEMTTEDLQKLKKELLKKGDENNFEKLALIFF